MIDGDDKILLSGKNILISGVRKRLKKNHNNSWIIDKIAIKKTHIHTSCWITVLYRVMPHIMRCINIHGLLEELEVDQLSPAACKGGSYKSRHEVQ